MGRGIEEDTPNLLRGGREGEREGEGKVSMPGLPDSKWSATHHLGDAETGHVRIMMIVAMNVGND
jgi:hypothetical protein